MVLLGRVLAQGGSGAEGYSQTSMLGEGPLRWEGFAQGLRAYTPVAHRTGERPAGRGLPFCHRLRQG